MDNSASPGRVGVDPLEERGRSETDSMILPAVAKYSSTVLSPGVTLMLFRPLLEDVGRARLLRARRPLHQMGPATGPVHRVIYREGGRRAGG